jgi:hypothetical protein
MAALVFFAALGSHWFNPSDDLPFYFVLPKKILETGSMYEPFAIRRILSFGAQAYLHAAFVAVAPIYYLAAVDGGICFVIVLALLVGLTRGGWRCSREVVGLGAAVLLLFSMPEVRINTNSEVSSLAALLTLYRTLRAARDDPADQDGQWPPAPRRTVCVACITAVCILLRTSNAPCVFFFLCFAFGSDYLLASRSPLTRSSIRTLGRSILAFGLAFAASLLPWSIMLRQSCGTFFYPLGKGNITPGWAVLEAPKGLGGELAQLFTHLFYGKPVATFLALVIAGLAPVKKGARSDIAALSIASLLGLAVLSHQSAAFPDADAARYYFPFVAAAALVVAASSARMAEGAVLVAIGVAAHLALSRDEARTRFPDLANRAMDPGGTAGKAAFDAATTDYADIQAHIPAATTIATAVFEGFRFDFRRNHILLLDVLGAMGPPPGWPTQKGPEALAAYLRKCGVQYLVAVDFNAPSEFYNRAHWTTLLGVNGSYLQHEAKLVLDAEDAIDKLVAKQPIMYRSHGMAVVDLDSTAP